MKNYFTKAIDDAKVVHNNKNFIAIDKIKQETLITFGNVDIGEDYEDFDIKGSIRLNDKELDEFIKMIK